LCFRQLPRFKRQPARLQRNLDSCSPAAQLSLSAPPDDLESRLIQARPPPPPLGNCREDFNRLYFHTESTTAEATSLRNWVIPSHTGSLADKMLRRFGGGTLRVFSSTSTFPKCTTPQALEPGLPEAYVRCFFASSNSPWYDCLDRPRFYQTKCDYPTDFVHPGECITAKHRVPVCANKAAATRKPDTSGQFHARRNSSGGQSVVSNGKPTPLVDFRP